MLKEFFKLLAQYERCGDFTYTEVNEDMLSEVEKRLGTRIPSEYGVFLKTFGHGGIGGIEVLGVGKNGTVIFENETLKHRAQGLPNELIVIENCDEWLYCINSIDERTVMWAPEVEKYSNAYDSFEEYLQDRLNDVLENM